MPSILHMLIKDFIIWYMGKYCNSKFSYQDKTVRMFSESFYEYEVKPHLDDLIYIKNKEV